MTGRMGLKRSGSIALGGIAGITRKCRLTGLAFRTIFRYAISLVTGGLCALGVDLQRLRSDRLGRQHMGCREGLMTNAS